MTVTDTTPADADVEPAQSVPESAKRRGWRRRQGAAAERRSPQRNGKQAARTVEVAIEPGDPLLDLLRTQTGPVAIEDLPAFSPAVRQMRADGVRLVVPLVAAGELVGLLALGDRLSERGYSRDDKKLLESLARHAAPALRVGQLVRQQEEEARNLQRIESELQVAQLIQQHFLPSQLPTMNGWQVDAFYLPGPDGRRGLLRRDRPGRRPDHDRHRRRHRQGRAGRAGDGQHARAAAGRRPGRCHPGRGAAPRQRPAASADPDPHVRDLPGAHRRPRHGRDDVRQRRAQPAVPPAASGEVSQLSARGMPLGLMPGSTYEEHTAQIEPGDIVVLYSDGITEQHDADGEMFGFERAAQVVATAALRRRAGGRGHGRARPASASGSSRRTTSPWSPSAARQPVAPTRLRFTLPSATGNEREAMDRVVAFVADALPPDRLASLGTAVSETAMNAIEHGNKDRVDLPIEIEVTIDSGDGSGLSVTDLGGGRPAGDFELPDLDLKLAGLQSPRGWGLFLVEQLVDSVTETDRRGRRSPHGPSARCTGAEGGPS